jgi:hypothetical protein
LQMLANACKCLQMLANACKCLTPYNVCQLLTQYLSSCIMQHFALLGSALSLLVNNTLEL